MNAEVLIRPSQQADIDEVTAIYTHHVQHGTGTFEIEPPDSVEMVRRRSEIVARGLPHLVAEIDGRVAGFAYAGPYRPRAAYRFTLEDSIYVHPERIRQGVGQALLPRLISECRQAGSRQIIAVVGDSDNIASIRLHERFGFRKVGVLEAVGFKFDRWLDSVLLQIAL